jgi:hypothetical protein
MDDPAVAQLGDGDLVDPLEAAPSRGMAEPGAQVGGRASELADDRVALGGRVGSRRPACPRPGSRPRTRRRRRPGCGRNAGRVGRWPRIRRGQGRGSRRRRTPARGGHGHRTRPATPRRSRPAPPGRTAGWSAARSCRHDSLGACVEGAVRRVWITLSGHWGRLRLPPQAARAAGPPGSPTGRSINCAKRTTSPVTIGPLGPPGSGAASPRT